MKPTPLFPNSFKQRIRFSDERKLKELAGKTGIKKSLLVSLQTFKTDKLTNSLQRLSSNNSSVGGLENSSTYIHILGIDVDEALLRLERIVKDNDA